MSEQWKPGDVVVATVNGRPNVKVIAGWSKYDPQLRWGELSTRWADGDDDEAWFMPSQVTDHRPLVLIDPEDAEQVQRLTRRYYLQRDEVNVPPSEFTDHMQAALRSLAEPTPPEPTGLGAVVRDNYGRIWERIYNPGTPDYAWKLCDKTNLAPQKFDRVPQPVTLLAEGWSE